MPLSLDEEHVAVAVTVESALDLEIALPGLGRAEVADAVGQFVEEVVVGAVCWHGVLLRECDAAAMPGGRGRGGRPEGRRGIGPSVGPGADAGPSRDRTRRLPRPGDPAGRLLRSCPTDTLTTANGHIQRGRLRRIGGYGVRLLRDKEQVAPLVFADLDLATFHERPLDSASLRCVRYMHDVEYHTVCYLRDLLLTRAHRDPEVTAFLGFWVFEEFWHGEALAALLAAHGELSGTTRVQTVREALGWRDRLRPALMSLGSSIVRDDFIAIHMAWGAINEWTTQSGYSLLARRRPTRPSQNSCSASRVRRAVTSISTRARHASVLRAVSGRVG